MSTNSNSVNTVDSVATVNGSDEMSVSYIRPNPEPFNVGGAIVGALIGATFGFLAVCFKQSIEYDHKGLQSTDPPAPCTAKYNTVLTRLLLDFQLTYINSAKKTDKKEYIKYIRNAIKNSEFVHVILESLVKKENIKYQDIYNANRAAEQSLIYFTQAAKLLPSTIKPKALEKINFIEGHLKDALHKISTIFNK